jgi:hypothetical protein
MKTWEERIRAAKKRGHFTKYEIARAENSWETCAIGEVFQVKSIKNFSERIGRDITHEAIDIGREFGWDVASDDFTKALAKLRKLRALRARQLKRSQ